MKNSNDLSIRGDDMESLLMPERTVDFGIIERKRNNLDDAAEQLTESVDWYLWSTGKSIVGSLYNGYSWGIEKITGR